MIPGFGYRFAPEAINSKYRKEYVESTLENGKKSEVIEWLERPLSQTTWQAKMKTPEIVSEVKSIYEAWEKSNSVKKATKAKDLLEQIKTKDVSFISKKHGFAFSISYISKDEETYFRRIAGKEGYLIHLNTDYCKFEKIAQKLDKYEALGVDADIDLFAYVLSEEDCLSFVQSFKEKKWSYEYEKENEREDDFER